MNLRDHGCEDPGKPASRRSWSIASYLHTPSEFPLPSPLKPPPLPFAESSLRSPRCRIRTPGSHTPTHLASERAHFWPSVERDPQPVTSESWGGQRSGGVGLGLRCNL